MDSNNRTVSEVEELLQASYGKAKPSGYESDGKYQQKGAAYLLAVCSSREAVETRRRTVECARRSPCLQQQAALGSQNLGPTTSCDV
eukprot:6213565-Pleurochrysis_carterae.AAC.5